MNPEIADVLEGRSRWCVIHGDCLDVLPTLPEGCVDAVVTDPPYGIEYQSARRTDIAARLPRIANDEAPFVWWLGMLGCAKPVSALVCFARADVQEAFRLAIGWAGWTIKSHLVWDRKDHGMGDLTGAFAPQHDVAWHAVRGKPVLYAPTRPFSVLPFQRIPADALVHPNEKPVSLMRYIVRAVTPPAGLVLDCFAGSGATGSGAILEGRCFIGIEKDAEYVEIAKRRIADAEAQGNLFGEAS